MLHTFYSHRLEDLADHLADQIEAERRTLDRARFAPSVVLIQDRRLAEWLSLRIAARLGVMARIEFHTVAEYARLLTGGRGWATPVAWRARLAPLLQDRALMSRPEFEVPRRYLGESDDEALAARRAAGLAGELARLFCDWALETARPERGRPPGWMGALWQEVERRSGPMHGPAEVARAIDRAERLPAIVHLFGGAGLRAGHWIAIRAIARRAIVWGYAFEPCAEHWHDVEFGRRIERSEGGDEFEDDFWSDRTPGLVRAWGGAGARLGRRRQEAEDDWDLLGSAPPDDRRLLGRLQREIVSLERAERPGAEPDDSIRIRAAPDARREVEAVADAIWASLAADETLRPHQIHVLVSPASWEHYVAHIESVFAASYGLPYALGDVLAVSWSRALAGARALLSLPFGAFRRAELLRVLAHPNVISASEGAESWPPLCEELGILHGADRDDHAGTYIEGEVFHWDQGLKRLALGAMIATRHEAIESPVEIGRRAYVPREVDADEIALAGRFVAGARALIAEAKFMRSARMPLGDWGTYICRVLGAYLREAGPEDERPLREARGAALAIASFGGEAPVAYRVAYDLFDQIVSGIELGRRAMFVDGVSVMKLSPGRAIPCREAFVLGMNEGEFPRPDRREPEAAALGAAGRPIGRRALDRYALLEALMGARERFHMSYIDRHPRSGEERAPASVVSDLIEAVAESVGRPDEVVRRGLLVTYGPTRGALDEPARATQPESIRIRSVRRARRALEARCAERGARYPARLEELEAALKPRAQRAMRARLGWVAPPEPGAEEEDDEIVRVSIQELRSFLECPMQASARRHAGLRPECADAMLQESESFEADALASHRLLPAVFWSKLRRQRAEKRAIDFDEEYDALARPLELTGRLPTGPFFHATRARHIERLNTWQDNLIELGYGASPRVRRRGFGVREILDGVDAARAPLELRVELGGRTRRVEIVGRTGPIVTDWEWPTVIQLVGARLAELPQKYFMRGFLDQVVVTAAGEGGERPWSVLLSPADLAGRGRRSKCVRRFHPLDQDRALTYIRDLVAQLLSGFQGYYFPIEAILESASRSEELPAALEKKRADPYRMTSSDYGPILNPRGYPIASDPITLAARRFSLYFETSIDR